MISFCLSADAMALLVRKSAHWISSVRGNLPRNYHFDYGLTGLLLAKLHLMTLGLADKVVAMTEPMAEQVGCYINRRPAIIGNFVDEAVLEPYRRPAGRNKPLHFVFLGSLSARKQPLELIAAAHQLINSGKTIQVTLVGEGVLRADIEAAIRSANLKDNIQLTGQLDDPYLILAQADALVLPSMSEGVSRAVLEALHLGIPAVLRDVDGNREVIEPGINGTLFSDPAQLSRCMLEAADLRRSITSQQSLLPSRFRQKACASSYLDLAEAL
ncbi:glycosyltransferase [Ahrensia marina]|uniref:glycosyltransferase n=1 Tax=Ahrensia marina TaxID=1514904 RepID=UPI0035D134B3